MAACTTETLQTDIDMTEFTISSVKNDTNGKTTFNIFFVMYV